MTVHGISPNKSLGGSIQVDDDVMSRFLDFRITDDSEPSSQVSYLLATDADALDTEDGAKPKAPLPGTDIALYTWVSLAFGCVVFLTASVATGPDSGPQMLDMARTAPAAQPQVERVVAMNEDGLPAQTAWAAKPLPLDASNLDTNPVGTVGEASEADHIESMTAAIEGLPEPLAVTDQQRSSTIFPNATHSAGKHAARLRAPDGKPIPGAAFVTLSQRAPDLMGRLSASLYRGELITGPFTTSEAVASFCRSVTLRLTLGCEPTEWPISDG